MQLPSLSMGDDIPAPFWSQPEPNGEYYTGLLTHFHSSLEPRNYLEVGVYEGETLQMSKCDTIAIDPILDNVKAGLGGKPSCHLYGVSSDDYFKKFNPIDVFRSPLDLVYLDGLHHFETLLRDFMNVERFSDKSTIVLLHDCIPVDAHVNRRNYEDMQLAHLSKNPLWWAGDVWKMVAILRRYRRDLRVLAYNSFPTGLVGITNLDPGSDLLKAKYGDVCDEFASLSFGDIGYDFVKNLSIYPTESIMAKKDLLSMFNREPKS